MPDPSESPLVPPPVSEVTVRTMASDLAALQAAGGFVSAPAGESLAPHPVVAGSSSHALSSVLGWLAVVLALLALGGGGYLGYRYLTAESALPTATSTQPAVTSVVTQGDSLSLLGQTVQQHASRLVKQAGYATSFPVVPASGTLKTHFQLIRDGLDRIPASARVAEITPTDASGRALSFAGYLAAIGADQIISRDTYTKYVEDDFSLLAVRGQGGFSAAYVLALRPNTTWLYAQPGIKALETAPGTPNLFLQIPGSLSAPFSDDTIADTPVRTATYENPAGTLTYGFFRDRLVIATSRQALDQALLLLCFEAGSC